MMRRWQKRLLRLVTEECCPFYGGWPWRSTAVPPVRRWASRCQGRGRWSGARWLFALLLTITWPGRLLWLIGSQVRAHAPTITARTGKSARRQAGEQLWLGLRHALPPVAYYTYEFYRADQWRWIDAYIHQYEASTLLPALNRDHTHPAIADKAHFAQLCAAQQLPTVPILGLCAAGRCDWLAAATGDLFVKPRCGARGEGTMMWRRLAADRYQAPDGASQSWAVVVAEIAAASQQQAYLVQPCLTNHPALEALSPGALATARLVTGRTPAGEIVTVAATFKMAWQPSIINTHGLNSAIGLTTGQLARAYSYGPICPGYDTHPVTGARITGVTLPDWLAAVALAHQAHHCFPGYVFLGWDVAFTDQGILLLEGNAGWDVMTVQKPQGIPLGATRFAELCAQHQNLHHR